MESIINSRNVILFDLDGTILDNYDWTYTSLKTTLLDFGYPLLTTEVYDTLQGMGERHALGKLGISSDKIDDLVNHRREIMKNSATKVTLFEGILELMSGLKQAGCKLGIVTGSGHDWVDIIPAVLLVIPYVDLLVTAEDTRQPKPHPAPIFFALEQLGADASQAVYIGDTPRDIEAAHRAGVSSVLASWNGGRYATDFICPPDFVASSIKELEHLLLG
jgi:pyrophosphatase PpaX